MKHSWKGLGLVSRFLLIFLCLTFWISPAFPFDLEGTGAVKILTPSTAEKGLELVQGSGGKAVQKTFLRRIACGGSGGAIGMAIAFTTATLEYGPAIQEWCEWHAWDKQSWRDLGICPEHHMEVEGRCVGLPSCDVEEKWQAANDGDFPSTHDEEWQEGLVGDWDDPEFQEKYSEHLLAESKKLGLGSKYDSRGFSNSFNPSQAPVQKRYPGIAQVVRRSWRDLEEFYRDHSNSFAPIQDELYELRERWSGKISSREDINRFRRELLEVMNEIASSGGVHRNPFSDVQIRIQDRPFDPLPEISQLIRNLFPGEAFSRERFLHWPEELLVPRGSEEDAEMQRWLTLDPKKRISDAEYLGIVIPMDLQGWNVAILLKSYALETDFWHEVTHALQYAFNINGLGIGADEFWALRETAPSVPIILTLTDEIQASIEDLAPHPNDQGAAALHRRMGGVRLLIQEWLEVLSALMPIVLNPPPGMEENPLILDARGLQDLPQILKNIQSEADLLIGNREHVLLGLEAGTIETDDQNELLKRLGIKRSPIRNDVQVGRNEACPCGSGKKYKKCCGP